MVCIYLHFVCGPTEYHDLVFNMYSSFMSSKARGVFLVYMFISCIILTYLNIYKKCVYFIRILYIEIQKKVNEHEVCLPFFQEQQKISNM